MSTKAGWAIAAAATLSAVLLACRIATFDTELKLFRSDSQLARMEVHSLNQQLEAEHILAARMIADLRKQQVYEPFTFVSLASPPANTANLIATIVWQPSTQSGAFISDQLPPLGPDEEYILWIECAEGVLNLGRVATVPPHTTQAQLKPSRPVTNPTRIMLTRERKGAADQPAGPILLTGSL